MSDGVHYEYNIFCQRVNSFIYLERFLDLFFTLCLFEAGGALLEKLLTRTNQDVALFEFR